jgi:hypothetical protein
MEAVMFLKNFIFGWLGIAALFTMLVWGMTPRVMSAGTDVNRR